MKIEGKLAPKPWGKVGVPHAVQAGLESVRIGEVVFEPAASRALPVLIKYLFTTERLSIQVHPNNSQAHRAGLVSGKDEMWVVLDAEPDATIGLGLTREVSEEELRAAILDGSIEQLVDWRPVQVGDVIYNTAGTIHAAGAGLTLLEVQQAADVTYRLYDYGRPRELHLEQGIAVSRPGKHVGNLDSRLKNGESKMLVEGPYFSVAWCDGHLPKTMPVSVRDAQLVVVKGSVEAGFGTIEAGECALLPSIRDLRFQDGAVALLAWPAADELAVAA